MDFPLAILLMGPESSGNHVVSSLFAQVCYYGIPLLGTDLAGWMTGNYAGHEREYFHPVWTGQAPLESLVDGQSFATNRSVPCGGEWPDLKSFAHQARTLGYTVLPVPILRDSAVVRRGCARRGLSQDLEQNWKWIMDEIDPNSGNFLSYEGLVGPIGPDYFRRWLTQLAHGLTIDPIWFRFVRDENFKYLAPDLDPCQLQ